MSQPIDDVQILRFLHQQGFRGDKLRTAFAVVKGESGGNPRAFNGDTSTGDMSYGLAQINMIGDMGKQRQQQWGLQSPDDLYDPATNIRAMWDLSKQGQDWSPWSVHPASMARGGK